MTGRVESPAWSYSLGLQEGWMPTDPRLSEGACENSAPFEGPLSSPFEGTFQSSITGSFKGPHSESCHAQSRIRCSFA